ncbi:hypothetical protein NHX12_009839 [Muraenolepis orangiensis]|uniref:Calpain catalytic domain-containing protein n=1 Tax=Muraenolepis orangiensis TaxID=630683 RepID=A0A9Q0DIE9_9TELE|nr:hypothetical protein NHX12_009839 [Muraenolepis orangiensis]
MPEYCTSIINLRYKDGSVGTASNPEMFNRQSFEKLKRDSLRRGSLFVDHTFPPDRNSLGAVPTMQQWQQQQVKWQRPADVKRLMGLESEASFLVDGASRLDFGQGLIANCWFLAAIGSLTLHKELLVQVVPHNQSFEDYAGIFHFRFWTFGRWVDVVIDDFLPTFQNQLLSVKSKSVNEFWVPLLEKAYAKLCGSYADMHAGNPSEAFKDFCGGVFMNYELKNKHDYDHDDELWGCLSRASDCKSMIGCGTFAAGGVAANTLSKTGLVDWHAYSVTGVTEVTHRGSTVRLVRLLNPWGRQEWSGKWSDKSELWNEVSFEDRENLVKQDDGEFWMQLEDYCHNFNYIAICCENPNFMDGDLTCQWKCMSYNGRWIAGKSAGGGPWESTFHMNPQFRINVSSVNGENMDNNNLLLSLMQKTVQNRNNASKNTMGFSIYKLPESTNAGKVDPRHLRNNLVRQSYFTTDREVMELIKVEPGEYVVIPHHQYSNCSGDFLLTVYTKAASEDLGITQLQRLLNETLLDGKTNGFDLTTCRSLVAFSNPRGTSGKIDFPLFAKLWEECIGYKELFHQCDADRSGALSLSETVNAAHSRGIAVGSHTIRMLSFRYSGFNNQVPLEGFVALMLQLDSNNSRDVYEFEYYENDIDDDFYEMSIFF